MQNHKHTDTKGNLSSPALPPSQTSKTKSTKIGLGSGTIPPVVRRVNVTEPCSSPKQAKNRTVSLVEPACSGSPQKSPFAAEKVSGDQKEPRKE